jgi:hypothetical protein
MLAFIVAILIITGAGLLDINFAFYSSIMIVIIIPIIFKFINRLKDENHRTKETTCQAHDQEG